MDRSLAADTYTAPAIEALHAFGVRPHRVDLVSVSENVTFRVSDGDADYALRLHRPGYHTLAELESERLWTQALTAAGVDAPSCVPARDGRYYLPVAIPASGEQRYAGMLRWTEGEVLDEIISREPDAGTLPGRFEQLGAILGAMHNQASLWQVPPGFTRHHLDVDGLMGEAPFWGRFWEHPSLAPDERALMLKTRDGIRGALDRYGKSTGLYSVIHADLHPGNILVDGERLSVIDFDDAGFGWHMYDVAVSLAHQQSASHFPLVRNALFRGYRTIRSLSRDDEAMLPMFLLIRGMATIGWLAQRPEHTGLEHTNYLARLRAIVRAQCDAFQPPC